MVSSNYVIILLIFLQKNSEGMIEKFLLSILQCSNLFYPPLISIYEWENIYKTEKQIWEHFSPGKSTFAKNI